MTIFSLLSDRSNRQAEKANLPAAVLSIGAPCNQWSERLPVKLNLQELQTLGRYKTGSTLIKAKK
jgi:hypothetical protein